MGFSCCWSDRVSNACGSQVEMFKRCILCHFAKPWWMNFHKCVPLLDVLGEISASLLCVKTQRSFGVLGNKNQEWKIGLQAESPSLSRFGVAFSRCWFFLIIPIKKKSLTADTDLNWCQGDELGAGDRGLLICCFPAELLRNIETLNSCQDPILLSGSRGKKPPTWKLLELKE